ncbi:hypothetical protein WDU94_006082, partial [Cyamophila willieti]
MNKLLPGRLISLVILLSQFCWSNCYRRRRTTTPVHKFNYTRYKLYDDPKDLLPLGPYEEVLPLPSNHTGGLMLFNFTELDNVNNWTSIDDQFHAGDGASQSSAKFHTIWAPKFQRVILYSWMNPKDKGKGFAGTRLDVELNLTNYDRLVMYGHAWKSNSGHRMVLYHNGEHAESHPSYQQKINTKTKDHLMELPFSEFKPILRGVHVPDAPPLNKGNITRVEIRVIGGLGGDGVGGYFWDQALKYGGIGRLELEWIKA